MRDVAHFVRVFTVAVLLSIPGIGIGQDDPATEVVQLNQEAMRDYQNMKIDDAVATLQKAEGICLQFGLQGHELALTYVNMGVIEVAGKQNEAAATDFFSRALCFEPTIQVDPLVSAPEVEKVFEEAKKRNDDPDVCTEVAVGLVPPPPPGGELPPDIALDEPIPPPPSDAPIPPPPPPDLGGGPPPPQSENIRHDGVTQQERMVPVPIYTLVQPGTPVDKVVLFYRTYGERIFQQLTMEQMGEGYGATIGCDVLQTFNPTAIEYYISVLDSDGQLIGYAGNEAEPFTTVFVDTVVGDPPQLPNSSPPEKCLAECPPWNPNCNAGAGGCKQFGDVCSSDSDCCKGMVCEDDMCAPGDAKGGSYKPFFRVALSFGTGAGFIRSEEVKPYNRIAEPNYNTWIDINREFCKRQGYSSSEERDCYNEISDGIKIGSGVAWAKLHFRATPMFYITDRIMVGASFRGGLPLDSNKNVMKVAPLGVAFGGYRILGEGKDMYELTAILGVGGGFVLHKISYDDCSPFLVQNGHEWYPDNKDGLGCHNDDISDDSNEWVGPDMSTRGTWEQTYFRKSGFIAIEAGIEQYLWITKLIGVNLGIVFDVLVPDFALNGDIQLGVAFRM